MASTSTVVSSFHILSYSVDEIESARRIILRVCSQEPVNISLFPQYLTKTNYGKYRLKSVLFLSIARLYNPHHNFVCRSEHWQSIKRVVRKSWFIRKVSYIQLHPGSAQNLGPDATIPSNQDLILVPPEVR